MSEHDREHSSDSSAGRRATLDWAAIRQTLEGAGGARQWRSLEELADQEEFLGFLRAEFPAQAPQWLDPVGRRQFLKLMGASLALAGLTACTRQPEEHIVPYVRAPEQIVPGKPLFFATAMPLGGSSVGVLVESHMGRPIKVEGNPEHPASLGATDLFAQASVLTLYDPDRSQSIRYIDEIRPWTAFASALSAAVAAQRATAGAGLRILTGTVTSPTLAEQLRQALRAFPEAVWHQYEPVGTDNARAAARLAFGEDADVYYRFDRAEVILSLDADFLSCVSSGVRYMRDFSRGRRVDETAGRMNRLYVVEAALSNTGAMADHRLPVKASEVEGVARAIAAALGVEISSQASRSIEPWVTAVVEDLRQHRGSSLVVAGDGQPPAVHVLAHAINEALGNSGKTVFYIDPVAARPVDGLDSLRELVEAMEAGSVEMLLILGGNPVYDAPADLEFSSRMRTVPLRIHFGLYDDETSQLCHWHVPAAHYLESWSDTRSYDGTATILQPLIEPLYGGKTAHELLAFFTERAGRSSYDIVRERWSGQIPAPEFERFWRRSLHDGVVAGSAFEVRSRRLQAGWQERIEPSQTQAASRREEDGLEIVFRPDPTVYDGQFANNAWLQELPKAITRLTWDNAALLSPATAERLDLESGEVVDLELEGRAVRAPVWIVAGQAPETVVVHLGYGRTRAGRIGSDAGFDAYALRTTRSYWFAPGLRLRKTGTRQALACTQDHHAMHGRGLVRAATLEDFRRKPEFAAVHPIEDAPSLYPEYAYPSYAWGMSIDLNLCSGCNACVVACQAENNVPVVGKDQVLVGREMHWLRIDRYYEGELDNPTVYQQPVLCMHCERAPCEVVCPVNATVHSREGLNDMVYNRCVGTRYCSNNCPYKVRRFNFFLYSDWRTKSLRLLQNPDVTVRSRGVMEKCTYCVQRISAARIEAKKEDRTIRDGEVVTACQAACPAQAIVFGNINDPDARVTRLKASPRNYGLLAELGTVPRTTYLAALRNPNPKLT